MFEILNGLFLAGMMLANITLYSDEDYRFPEDRETVTAVSTHREWWREDGNGKCKYTGVMVPFVRDWEQVIKHGETERVLPPEPDKTAGQAFIINRKVCGEKVEPVFRVTEIWSAKGAYLYKHTVAAYDLTDMRQDQRPQWLEQVLRRVERAAANNDQAKAFIEFNKTASFEKMPADVDALLKSLGHKPGDTSVTSTTPEAPPATPQ